jgi:hypothetical protein
LKGPGFNPQQATQNNNNDNNNNFKKVLPKKNWETLKKKSQAEKVLDRFKQVSQKNK